MNWDRKKMVQWLPHEKKTMDSQSRRKVTKLYYLKRDNKKERVWLKTFIET